jgi:hypothetical protein
MNLKQAIERIDKHTPNFYIKIQCPKCGQIKLVRKDQFKDRIKYAYYLNKDLDTYLREWACSDCIRKSVGMI